MGSAMSRREANVSTRDAAATKRWKEAEQAAGRQLEHASLTLQAFFRDPRHKLLLTAFMAKYTTSERDTADDRRV